jgi:hypothetical protein
MAKESTRGEEIDELEEYLAILCEETYRKRGIHYSCIYFSEPRSAFIPQLLGLGEGGICFCGAAEGLESIAFGSPGYACFGSISMALSSIRKASTYLP